MMRLSATLSAALLLICLLAACSTTTVYVVRHAEKVDETDSTDLSRAGQQRAFALADVLAKRGIDSIFTTPYRRTRQTAQPLAQRLNIQPVTYPASPVNGIIQRVNRIRHRTVMIVGHSNTILPIAQGLGARPTMSQIEPGDYDNLLTLRIKHRPFGKKVTLSERTYGETTRP